MIAEEDVVHARLHVLYAFDAHADTRSLYAERGDLHSPAVHCAEIFAQRGPWDPDECSRHTKNEIHKQHPKCRKHTEQGYRARLCTKEDG